MDIVFLAAMVLIMAGGVLQWTRYITTGLGLTSVGTGAALAYTVISHWSPWAIWLLSIGEAFFALSFFWELAKLRRSRREEVAS